MLWLTNLSGTVITVISDIAIEKLFYKTMAIYL
jgi:hypothetical protein